MKRRRQYHYRIRPYPRQKSVVWRWFVFEGAGNAVATGIVTEPNRDKAEAEAKAAIERLTKTNVVAPGSGGQDAPEDHAAGGAPRSKRIKSSM
jgi:hypothetical protein